MKKALNVILSTLLMFSTMILFGDFEQTATIKDVLTHWLIWITIIAILGCTLYFINPSKTN